METAALRRDTAARMQPIVVPGAKVCSVLVHPVTSPPRQLQHLTRLQPRRRRHQRALALYLLMETADPTRISMPPAKTARLAIAVRQRGTVAGPRTIVALDAKLNTVPAIRHPRLRPHLRPLRHPRLNRPRQPLRQPRQQAPLAPVPKRESRSDLSLEGLEQ